MRCRRLTRETVQHHTGAGSAEEARERALELSLEGVAERIEQPCLVITGRHDRLIPWEDTKRIADEARNATWVLYDDGNHVCNNIPYKYRPLVGDWMAERLSVSARPVGVALVGTGMWAGQIAAAADRAGLRLVTCYSRDGERRAGVRRRARGAARRRRCAPRSSTPTSRAR